MILISTMLISLMQLSAQSMSYEEISEIQKRPKVKLTEYTASTGDVFRVGDSILLMEPMTYALGYKYIYESTGFTLERASSSNKGWKAEIIKFKILGTKRSGFAVDAICKTEFGLSRLQVSIESALFHAEIYTNTLANWQVIEKLKSAKE